MTKTISINGTPVTFRGERGRVDARVDFDCGVKMIGFVNGLERKGLKFGSDVRTFGGENDKWVVAVNMAAADILKLAGA